MSAVRLITRSSCHLLGCKTEGRMKQVGNRGDIQRERSDSPPGPFIIKLINIKVLTTAPQPVKLQLCHVF